MILRILLAWRLPMIRYAGGTALDYVHELLALAVHWLSPKQIAESDPRHKNYLTNEQPWL